MLEGLDRIDWARLTHAYGPATDIPALLRAVAVGGRPQAGRALSQLDDLIVDEGRGGYTATPATIPFLVELALRPGAHVPGLLHLLRAIAAPIHQYMLNNGLSTETFYAEMAHAEASQSASNHVDGGTYGGFLRVQAECLAALSAAVPQLSPLLNGGSPSLVAALLMLLAEVPERWADSAPRIAQTIDRSTDPTVQIAGLKALGRLARSVETGSLDALLRPWLSPRHSLPVRTEAALSMTSKEPARRDVLRLALQNAGALYGADRAESLMVFAQGRMADRVSAELARWRGPEAQRIETVTTIISAMPQAQTAEAGTTGLVRALLTALAAGAPIEGLYRGRRRSALTALDRDALQAIARHGDWTTEEGRNTAFSNLMQRCGLPDSAEGLARYATPPGPFARLLRR